MTADHCTAAGIAGSIDLVELLPRRGDTKRRAAVLVVAAVVGACDIEMDRSNEVIFDNHTESTAIFTAELDDGEIIELTRMPPDSGGYHLDADTRVFDDDECSVRPIEARTAEGELLFTFPVGSCAEIILRL